MHTHPIQWITGTKIQSERGVLLPVPGWLEAGKSGTGIWTVSRKVRLKLRERSRDSIQVQSFNFCVCVCPSNTVLARQVPYHLSHSNSCFSILDSRFPLRILNSWQYFRILTKSYLSWSWSLQPKIPSWKSPFPCYPVTKLITRCARSPEAKGRVRHLVEHQPATGIPLSD
jgi:hypothetical protein